MSALMEHRDPAEGLLDEVLQSTTKSPSGESRSPLEQFLEEPSPWKALCLWFGLNERSTSLPTKPEITRRLSRVIAQIDVLLARQVNAILHHPAFQKLEASWRGLRYLVGKLPDDDSVKIRMLSVSWGELVQDQARALEFDQSQLFRKVYEAEFGHPGGEPFGVLLGDYEIRHRLGADHPYDDIETLSKISTVAAAAFAPFITGVHPSFFGLDSFTELERPLNLSRTFEQLEYLNWRALRQSEDARFVGLTLPRVLMRLPYGAGGARVAGLRSREEVEGPDCSNYLWGNAVYAFGGVLIRCFAHSGWLADIRGVRQGVDPRGGKVCLDEGGLVSGLPVHSFRTDKIGVATKCSTDVIITDDQERELGDLGFIPLCHCYDSEFSAFYGNQSIQKPAKYDDPKATANARLSAMLQYMLCVSRFAHYLKVISRDKIGSMVGPEVCEAQLG
ncbi:MAG: type VI secretion system contractile sheath large subunit, partial [Singulisphaera sp.]|nr:type VI secretion system contractile sheath large subunit [Singulisphaera sp.]